MSEPTSLTSSPLTSRTAAEAATSGKAHNPVAQLNTSSVPSIPELWVVSEEELMQTQKLNSVGTAVGERSSLQLPSGSMSKTMMNKLCEDTTDHESKKMRLVGWLARAVKRSGQ